MRRSPVILVLFFAANPLWALPVRMARSAAQDSLACGNVSVEFADSSSSVRTLDRTDIITISPWKIFYLENFVWTHKLGSLVTIGLGFEFGTEKQVPNYGSPQYMTTWSVPMEIRIYPARHTPQGFYFAWISTYTKSTNVQHEVEYLTSEYQFISDMAYDTYQTFSIEFLCGWEWIPENHWTVGFGLGVAAHILLSPQGDTAQDFNIVMCKYGDGATPTLRFDVGYAW